MSYFLSTAVNIVGNSKLRSPQVEAYLKIQEYFKENPKGEAMVVLPTGTGKSGLVSIAPYGISQKRVLIITPGLVTKDSILKTQMALRDNFWVDMNVILNPDDMPVINEYKADIRDDHLFASHFVTANIQKITSQRDTGLINRVRPDFFDMIIIDEAHHAPAKSWEEVLNYFSSAKKLHVTGTPYRGDGVELVDNIIHETKLSEVMRDKYVKWLRKETVNAHKLFFTIADRPGEQFTKEQVLELKEQEWVERSVALSKSCSIDVIQRTIELLQELKSSSPNVNHKILAVGCSISHADDIACWYEERGMRTTIVHSRMELEDRENAFRTIENHQCDVVVSVNMLMEGYDHRYLTVLGIFRPYRSLNAFAQVIGRVLRAIPDEEITDFAIDNNAVVVYHADIGLDEQWSVFQKEVDRAAHPRTHIREYEITEHEYQGREQIFAGISTDGSYIGDNESYIAGLDFNKLFEEAKLKSQLEADKKIQALKDNPDFDDDDLALLKKQLIEKALRRKAKDEIDPELIEKRPAQAQQRMRELLTKRSQDGVADLLSDLKIDEKGTDLFPKFKRHLPYLNKGTVNDGILVAFVYAKLSKRFGPVKSRDNQTLLQSLNAVADILDELRKMLS